MMKTATKKLSPAQLDALLIWVFDPVHDESTDEEGDAALRIRPHVKNKRLVMPERVEDQDRLRMDLHELSNHLDAVAEDPHTETGERKYARRESLSFQAMALWVSRTMRHETAA